MQATARMASVVSATSCARRRLIRGVRPTPTRHEDLSTLLPALLDDVHFCQFGRPEFCSLHLGSSHSLMGNGQASHWWVDYLRRTYPEFHWLLNADW